MNADIIASLPFPNITTGGSTADGTAHNAAVNDTFISLILSLLVGTRVPEVTEGGGSPFQALDRKPEGSAAFSPQDTEGKSGEVFVPDPEMLSILLSLDQNCFSKVLPQYYCGEQQTPHPGAVRNGRCKGISPDPVVTVETFLSDLPTAIEKSEEMLLDSVRMGDGGAVSKDMAPFKDPTEENPPAFPKASEEMLEGQEVGKKGQILSGVNITETGTEDGRTKPIQATSNSVKKSLPTTGKNNSGKEDMLIKPGAAELVLKEGMIREPEVLKPESLRSLVTGKDPVVDGTLPTGPQDTNGHDSPFPPKPSDGQPGDFSSVEVVRQIVEKAHLFVGKGVSSLRLQLKPEVLGNLRLTIKVEHGLVHARFTADNAVVAHLIETHLPELQNVLADRGIAWHQMSVSVDSQMNSGGFAHTRHEGGGYAQQSPYAQTGSPSGQVDRDEAITASYYYGNDVTVDYLV